MSTPEAAADAPVAPVEPIAAPVVAAAPAPPPVADPVALERARCAAIQAAALPGFGALAALAVASGWPASDFTAAQAASAEAVENARTEAAGATFRESLPAPVAGGGGGDPEPQDIEAKARADFAADANLRREFGHADTFVAFRVAEAAGKVRVLSKRA